MHADPVARPQYFDIRLGRPKRRARHGERHEPTAGTGYTSHHHRQDDVDARARAPSSGGDTGRTSESRAPRRSLRELRRLGDERRRDRGFGGGTSAVAA